MCLFTETVLTIHGQQDANDVTADKGQEPACCGVFVVCVVCSVCVLGPFFCFFFNFRIFPGFQSEFSS